MRFWVTREMNVTISDTAVVEAPDEATAIALAKEEGEWERDGEDDSSELCHQCAGLEKYSAEEINV